MCEAENRAQVYGIVSSVRTLLSDAVAITHQTTLERSIRGDLVNALALTGQVCTSIAKSMDELELITHDISDELWREYEFGGTIYRINNPQTLSYRPYGATHCIVGPDGIVHCVPAPGNRGCVLRWESKVGVSF